MKTFISTTLAFLTVLIFLSSCSTTKDVLSNNGIVKRKYRKGYYVQLPQLFNKQTCVLSALSKEENGANPNGGSPEIQLTASVENDIPLSNNENTRNFKPVSKFSKTIKSVKHLYDSDITDFTLFRKEYKNVKKDFRNKLIHSPKAENEVNLSLSIASFITGLAGLVIAGIIFGILAIAFGTIALVTNKKGGILLALLGIILGIIDIVGVLIYLSTL